MRLIASLWLIFAAVGSAGAQTIGPQVDQAEVLRLGNMRQVVGDGLRAAPDTDAYVAALGPPASDADKWFISVLTMKGCAGCEKLKQEWATSPWLLALANPTDAQPSWSHYNVYDQDDRSQAFRFENLKVTAYPTILVQPPRSERYGDPSTVVFQGVYGGDPEQLARAITQAIRQYVSQLQPAPVRGGEHGQVGVDPPWQPVPKVDPWQPRPQPNPPFSPLDPTIPPQPPAPAPAFPWSSVLALVLAGFSLPAAAALVRWAVSYVRARRQAEGKPPLVDQATLERVLELLKQLAENPPPPPTPKT